MQVHLSGYYQWLKEPSSQRNKGDQRLTSQIKQFWLESSAHYGYRNIHKDLIEARVDCYRDRVLHLMQAANIKAVRGYNPPRGYYGGTTHMVVSNDLNRMFEVVAPNQWWVSDIT